MNIYAFSHILLGFTCLCLALFLLKFSRRKIHRIWCLFNLSLSIWGFGSFFALIADSPEASLHWWKFAHVGGLFVAVFSFHVVCLFCKIKRRILLVLGYTNAVIFQIFSFTNIMKFSVRYIFNSYYIYKPLDYKYAALFSVWLFLASLGFYELFVYMRKINKAEVRNQILYFFTGMAIGYSGGVMHFPQVFGIDIYPYGNFSVPIYCLVVTYAIIRYRLMDITVAITRTGVFVAIYSLVLGIPFAVTYSFKAYLIGFLGDNWWLVPMGVLTVLATAGPFIYIFFNSKAEERLLRTQRQYQNTLRQASSGMI
ncbi:hypothetical protein HQ550_04590, partial [bacterium]|nr:hypothetical protein [bacterium]